MADEWDQFKDADADEYGQFADAPGPKTSKPRKTSQSLGFMKGVAKPFENYSRANPLNVFDTEKARQTRDTARVQMNNYFAKREETQRPGAIGEIAGNIVGTAPIVAATRNPFAAGALQGAALTDANTPAGVAMDMGAGAILNFAGGKVMDGVADAIKPAIDPAVRRLSEAGVRLTPGMVKGGKAMVREDKRMSRPIVGDAIAAGRQKTQETFNKAAVDEILKPIGAKIPAPVKPGNDSIAYAKDQIEQAYNLVIPKLSVSINGQQFIQPIAQAAATLPKAQQATLRKITSVTLRNGQLQGQALKDAQGELRRLAVVYGSDASAEGRELGRVLSMMDENLTKEMLAQNPQWAPQLQKVNEAYRGYRTVADAASRADEGLINTGQLKQSVRRGDRTKNKDATARGEAFMQDFSADARWVIPAQAPNPSGTAAHMPQNLFAKLGGARDALAFRADDAYQQFRLAPRPAVARKGARAVRRLKGPGGVAAVAAASEVTRD